MGVKEAGTAVYSGLGAPKHVVKGVRAVFRCFSII